MSNPGGLFGQQSPMPMPRPSIPEDKLTAGQMFGLQYSRDRYADGSYQVNPGPDPSVTSFYGAIDQDPSGKWINYPTFWDGKIIDPKLALQKALDYEKQTGQQFARYPSLDAANKGEMEKVHPIMDTDAQKILAWPETQARLKATK